MIVIGKPCTLADIYSPDGGWMDPFELGKAYRKFHDLTNGEFDAGFMIW